MWDTFSHCLDTFYYQENELCVEVLKIIKQWKLVCLQQTLHNTPVTRYATAFI